MSKDDGFYSCDAAQQGGISRRITVAPTQEPAAIKVSASHGWEVPENFAPFEGWRSKFGGPTSSDIEAPRISAHYPIH